MRLRELVALHKANNAQTLSVNQTLHPGAATKLVDDVVALNDFLKKITIIKSATITHPCPVLTMSSQNLTHLVEGGSGVDENTKKAQSSNIGKDMTLRDVDLIYDLLYSAIDNDETGEIELTVPNQIANIFQNDLLDLGVNGLTDTRNLVYNETTNPVPMYTLHKGWVAIAKASSLAHKVNSHSDTDILVTMDKMIKNMPAKYRNKALVEFILSSNDYQDYVKLMAPKDASGSIAQTGKVLGFGGYLVNECPYLADGVRLLTNPKNLIMDFHIKGVKKSITNKPENKCYRYIYTLPCDYEISVDPAFVIAYDQGA